jgi:hypothetical protein
MTVRVALDVESVLAEPNEAVLAATDRLTRSQIEETWFSDSEEDHSYQIYMGVSDAIWRHNPLVIPPEEPNLSEYVDDMCERATVDILTHRQHVDEQVKLWLAEHGIRYDTFVSTDKPKQCFDYDIWIDDNPNLFGECRLLLRHQPWNAHLDASKMKTCDRIYSLKEAAKFV